MREERALGGRRENYRKKSLLLSAWRSSRDLSYAPLLSSFDCNLSVSHDLGAFVLQAAYECGVIQEKNLRFCPDFTRSFSFSRLEKDMAAARRGALHILRRPSGLISLTRGSGMAATVRAVATSSPLPSSSSSSSPPASSDSGILLFRGFSASNRTPSWHSSRFFAAEAAQSTGVVAVNSSLQYDTLLKEAKDDKKLAVTYFTAKWCGPCRHISPEVDRLSGQYNDVRFLKVDLDELLVQDERQGVIRKCIFEKFKPSSNFWNKTLQFVLCFSRSCKRQLMLLESVLCQPSSFIEEEKLYPSSVEQIQRSYSQQ
ncbi:hypothetical protein BDL97_07G035200 [Sphagnum fallax]|nr:hypothetical protein BDL97_07G035200 [Sphagnum fallax]